MAEITKEELQELRRLAEKAIPGPWKQLSGWTFDANNEFLQTGYESQLGDVSRVCIAYANPERIGRLLDAVEDRWIPVSERLPEEGVTVLAYSPDWSSIAIRAHLYCNEWMSDEILSEPSGVTHWRPLPTPPASEEKRSLP